MKKKNSIIAKTLFYLVLFSFTILFILWIFQTFFLSYFYEKYQIRNIDNLANSIVKGNIDSLEDYAFENNVCIEYITELDDITYNHRLKGCLLSTTQNETINTYKRTMYNSSNNIYKLKLVNPKYNTKSIMYGIRTSDGYIFINSTLESLDTTSKVLQGQLIYIIICVMTLSFFVAYFISKRVTKPIIVINEKAKQLSNGNFNVSFEKSGIFEIDELADTLNQAEKELKITDDLRRDLMANVSHDLKTPLTMIKAYAEKVRDLSYKNKEKREQDLNIIISETDRLNILVNDILVLSKMQSMSNDIDINEFDLSKTIKSIVDKYRIIKETLDYKFIVDILDQVIINGDEKKITQLIYNLVNNAINYTGSDNTVYICVKENKKDYYVSIRDTGRGINETDLPHIWERYYKNNKNHQRNVVGTGLGLSICKQVLELHKYQYGVKTKENEGTEFYFTIPK